MHYSKYQERSYELTTEQTKLTHRKKAHKARLEQIPAIREALSESRSKATLIREGMPWVTEQEQKDLVEKVEEVTDWLDKKMDEQEKKSLTEEPAFTMDDVET